MQYSNFKDTLQNIASQIGNVEQEVEEHKYVATTFFSLPLVLVCANFLFCHLRYPIAILELLPFGLETGDSTTTTMRPDEQKHDTCGIQCRINLSLDVRCSLMLPSQHWCPKYAFAM
jgi:hypothetical protein